MNPAAVSIVSLKRAMRSAVRKQLKSTAPERLSLQGRILEQRLLHFDRFLRAKSVCIFMSMPDEIPTNRILGNLLARNAKCFLPRMVGDDLKMLRVYQGEDLSALPRNAWGIAEPHDESTRETVFDALDLDLVLVPGLAFDATRRRLGKGRGFYDRFLTSYLAATEAAGKPRPYLLSLAFLEQMVPEVPIEAHDQVVDDVWTVNVEELRTK